MARTLYGYRNVVYFAGKPEGYAVVYHDFHISRQAMRDLRQTAINDGLSASAAKAGIYPITLQDSALSASEAEDLAIYGVVRH